MASDTAAAIVKSVGGAANIESLSHCATRLRFQLRDASGVQQSVVEAVPGVMGAVPQAGDRYQVVIGGGVQTVYNDIMELPGMAAAAAPRRGGDQGRRPREGSPRQVRLAGRASSSSCPTRSGRSWAPCSAPRCSSRSWR